MLALKLGLSLVSTPKLGGWSPDDESSLEAWYQNAVGITLNGSDVSQWEDSSSNSYDMVQSTVTLLVVNFLRFNQVRHLELRLMAVK